jgi:hypothetical protein
MSWIGGEEIGRIGEHPAVVGARDACEIRDLVMNEIVDPKGERPCAIVEDEGWGGG